MTTLGWLRRPQAILPWWSRVMFAVAVAWIVAASSIGSAPDWWTWPWRIASAVPGVVAGLVAVIAPRWPRCVWAAGIMAGFAVGSILRVQMSAYPWNQTVIATLAYSTLAVFAVGIALYVAVVTGIGVLHNPKKPPTVR